MLTWVQKPCSSFSPPHLSTIESFLPSQGLRAARRDLSTYYVLGHKPALFLESAGARFSFPLPSVAEVNIQRLGKGAAHCPLPAAIEKCLLTALWGWGTKLVKDSSLHSVSPLGPVNLLKFSGWLKRPAGAYHSMSPYFP